MSSSWRTPLEALIDACSYRNLDRVEQCLAECVALGVDINDTNNAERTTPLIEASHRRQLEITEYLLQYGADPNAHGKFGWTALHRALHDREVNLDIINVLLTHGADVMAVDEDRETIFHEAMGKKFNGQLLEMLIDAGADVTAPTTGGWLKGYTPLHKACRHESFENAAFLLQCGVDVNARDANGFTPLRIAAVQQHIHSPPLVELLLKHGADPNALDNEGNSIVWKHVHDGKVNTEVLQLLLDYGLDLLGANDPTKPLLHRMVWGLDTPSDALDMVIEWGLHVNAINQSGETPLHVVSAREWELSVSHARILLSRGAKAALTIENTEGYLPLHCATKMIPTHRSDDNVTFLSMLLKAGADVNATTRDGLSPMSLLLDYYTEFRRGKLPDSHDVFYQCVRLLCYYGATWDESCERRLNCMEQLAKTPPGEDATNLSDSDTAPDTITVQVKSILARYAESQASLTELVNHPIYARMLNHRPEDVAREDAPLNPLPLLSGLRSCIQFWTQERARGGDNGKLTDVPTEVYIGGKESVENWLKRMEKATMQQAHPYQ